MSLSPGVDARVLLSNLSDAFVADPAKSFPPGKLVRGTIVSLDAAKGFADMSLKSDASASAASRGLADLSVGEIVTGSVRKVETFGVFVTVDGCAVSGLCHISEVADERIKSLPARVSVGERVKAVVLRIDVEASDLSSVGNSYLSCPMRGASTPCALGCGVWGGVEARFGRGSAWWRLF